MWKRTAARRAQGMSLAACALAAALALSACGGTGTAQESGDASADDQAQATAVEATEEATEEAAEEATEEATEEAAEEAAEEATESAADTAVPQEADIAIEETYESTGDSEHAIEADGTTESYSNIAVNKTGAADGDEADFYGTNAAVFATNGATLDISNAVVKSDDTHANAVFSYGEGTTLNIVDSVIQTTGNCSGGIMVTGGGTLNATNLNIHTTGNSSAAIRSDRGGGTMNVTGGSYVTDGTGSPAIYSTADVTVSSAYLESTASQGVVVEGKNSVTLNDVDLVASNTTKNSDKSDYYQAVMIYQSMSGDAAEGLSSFTMTGGSLTNKNGDVFFVNNTATDITLAGVDIVNEDAEGVFLRAAAAGWGSEGSNGGQVNLRASDQVVNGDILVDSVSMLNLYLEDGSAFTGAVNPDGQEGDVYVELSGGSTWTLTGDSYITALTCDADSIDLNGYTLYVNGVAYEAGTASTGDANEVTVSSGSGNGSGGMEEPPSGGHGPSAGGSGSGSHGTPPSKPGE